MPETWGQITPVLWNTPIFLYTLDIFHTTTNETDSNLPEHFGKLHWKEILNSKQEGGR